MTEIVVKERSPGMKLLLAAIIGFVLMVPLMLVYALVWDRQSQSETAQGSINAGWGGDQLVLANITLAGKEFAAVALVLAMDSSAEAAELATIVETAFPGGCIDRAQGGPLVFVRDGARAGFAAGPYETVSGRSQATCSTVEAWLLQAVATATVK